MTKILKHYKNGELVYPNPAKDGLQLWYDVAGKRNTDSNKEVLEDLSGNGNDGVLQNFNFTEGSGYNKNKLLFDGIDDEVQIPDLQLSENAMSVQVGDKVYVYEDDKVLTVSENGSVEVGGRNLLRNGDFRNGTEHFPIYSNSLQVLEGEGYRGKNGARLVMTTKSTITPRQSLVFTLGVGETLTVQVKVKEISGDFSDMVCRFRTTFDPELQTIKELGDNWKLFIYSYTNNKNEPIVHNDVFGWYNTTGEFILSEIKVEKGTLATDWSPHPEDYKTTILSPSTLDKLQLYNRPLVKDEMLQNAESEGLKELKEGQVVQDGLILHYDFSKESNDSAYKGKAFDYSGNALHGTLQNFSYAEGSGYEDNGLRFDKVDDEILISPNAPSSQSYTLLATIETQGGANTEFIENHTVSAFYLRKIDDRLHGSVFSDSQTTLSANEVFTTDDIIELKNVGMIVDNKNKKMSLIVSGEIVATRSFEGELKNHKISALGRWASSESRLTGIKSAQYYNRPLTPEEIQHNYLIEKEKFNL